MNFIEQLNLLHSSVFSPKLGKAEHEDGLITIVKEVAKSAPPYLSYDCLNLENEVTTLSKRGIPFHTDPIIQKRVSGVFSKYLTCDQFSNKVVEVDDTQALELDRKVVSESQPILNSLKEGEWGNARQFVAKLPISRARMRLAALIEELDYYQRLDPEKATLFLSKLPIQFVEAMKSASHELDDRSRQCREEKNIDEAIDLALIIPSVFLRDPQLANLIEELVELGQFKRAEELLSAIQDKEWREEMVEKIERYRPK